MAKSKRVVFKFDAPSLRALEIMTKEGCYNSMAETICESLKISRALQTQAKQGFSEITLLNPDTGEKRVVVIPHLQSLAQEIAS